MTGIFRAYDIRGRYGDEINETTAYNIGRAFATCLASETERRPKDVVVGRDVRNSSASLADSLIKGLTECNCNVIDAGMVSTPIVAFATRFFCYDAGIAVTASHLGREYNGFKFFDEHGVAISYEAGINEIEKNFVSNNYVASMYKGIVTKRNVVENYYSFIKSKLNLVKTDISVAIDAIHGVMGLIAPPLLSDFCEVTETLRCDASGNFPEAGPDPSRLENLEMLKERVTESKCDVGFAYDGDGDRLAVVDEKGEVVSPTKIFALLIEHELKSHEEGKIVFDFVTSDAIKEWINQQGGVPLVCRVGHTYITRKLIEERAVIAGELSGHYYFKDMFGIDDALFASLKILEILQTRNEKLSKLCKNIPEYPMETINITVKEEKKFSFVEELRREFEERGYKCETLDGIKVHVDDGWLVIRPSNTENKIRIVYEAKSKHSFERLKEMAREIVIRAPK